MLLSIEKLIYGGDGLARTPADAGGRSLAVFVPFVLPGERVEAEISQEKAGFARGSVTRLVEPSVERVAARCPYFQQCGGCHYQHIPYEFLPVLECPISSPLIQRMMARLIELRGCDCPVEVEEIELFADAADERLLAWTFCERGVNRDDLRRWGAMLQYELPEIVGISFFPSRRRTEDEAPADMKPLVQLGDPAIRYRVGEKDYRVSAGAFFQVNRHLVDELVSVVTSNAGGDTALDLYAGVGLFSAVLARSFHHIFAVEASLLSHSDLVQNVPTNVKAVGTRTEDYLRSRPVRKRPDLLVIDPPRTGAGKAVTRWLVELGAPRVRYVSCDPATLARDLAPLLASGYRIEEAHLFDLFPQTFHIETVMLLAR
jgi:23S rRNA (uracil1939-C5)-methyltransferase